MYSRKKHAIFKHLYYKVKWHNSKHKAHMCKYEFFHAS